MPVLDILLYPGIRFDGGFIRGLRRLGHCVVGQPLEAIEERPMKRKVMRGVEAEQDNNL